ncbi:hypothetical protein C1S79_06055 [Mycolicibacterium phocaicum]|uniref:Uncharacterized protein n=1 Tax=Mycolicibacterium phocaicum TaxID=319706 RepID=A0AA94RF70_9MYCO|nr:hypothetical protein C1S79_06055 [Mycolicibacterium phocaicum]
MGVELAEYRLRVLDAVGLQLLQCFVVTERSVLSQQLDDGVRQVDRSRHAQTLLVAARHVMSCTARSSGARHPS